MLAQTRLVSAGSRPCGTLLPHRPQTRPRMQPCQSRAGRSEPFNEGAAQVKRLINRDRQEFLGNEEDILDKYREEFGASKAGSTTQQQVAADTPPTSNGASSSGSAASSSTSSIGAASPSSSTASPAAPSSSGASATSTATPAAPAAVKTSFRSPAPTASPFGPVVISKKANIEPMGLKPDMSPDPIVKIAPLSGTWLSRITITQVVLFTTFSSMIALMLGTFYVVLKAGGVRLAGLE